jgi:dolichol-phosphate mannosyltransferase
MKGPVTAPPAHSRDATTKVSAVTPCYNEAAVLVEFHRRMSAACGSVTDDYEIVLVNDGSSDGSWPALLSLAAEDPHVVAINLSRNHGQSLALTAGLTYCRGERIFIVDADLQDPPELLSGMMALCDRGADIVYGKRRSRAGESIFKRLTAFLFYRLLNFFTDQRIPEDTGDFRLITRRLPRLFLPCATICSLSPLIPTWF